MAVLLVDDCPADIERLGALMGDVFDDEVFSAHSFEEGLELIEWLPNVEAALFDNLLGDGLGIDLAVRLVEKFPSCAPIVMSDFPLRGYVSRWLSLGLPGMLSAKSLSETAVRDYKQLADEFRTTSVRRVTLCLDEGPEDGLDPIDARDLVLEANKLTVKEIVEAALSLAHAWGLDGATSDGGRDHERTLVAPLVEPLGKHAAALCRRSYDAYRRDRTDIARVAREHEGYDGPRDVDVGVLLLAVGRANYERLLAERRAALGLPAMEPDRPGPVKVRDEALRAELESLLERSRVMQPLARQLAALAEAALEKDSEERADA